MLKVKTKTKKKKKKCSDEPCLRFLVLDVDVDVGVDLSLNVVETMARSERRQMTTSGKGDRRGCVLGFGLVGQRHGHMLWLRGERRLD